MWDRRSVRASASCDVRIVERSSNTCSLISVINFELTERSAKHFFSLATDPDKLLTLKPSGTMEKTGNIFDPEHYMIDRGQQRFVEEARVSMR